MQITNDKHNNKILI